MLLMDGNLVVLACLRQGKGLGFGLRAQRLKLREFGL